MPIGDLSNKVSSSDVAKVKDKRNPPEFEEGFGPDDSSDGLDSIFDDINIDDLDTSAYEGGIKASDIFGMKPKTDTQTSGGFGSFGQTSSFGQPSGLSVFGQPSGFNSFNQPQQQAPQKPDTLDRVMEEAGKSMKSIGKIMVELVKSVKNRTADDWGLYSRNIIVTSAVIAGTAILLTLIGTAANVAILKIGGIPLQLLLCATLTFGSGLIGISLAALKIASSSSHMTETVYSIPDVVSDSQDIDFEITSDEDESLEDILGDLFKAEEDEFDFGGIEDSEPVAEPKLNNIPVDYNKTLEQVPAKVPLLTRETLINIFRQFLPTNTPGFADKKIIDENSEEFATIETLCLKALAAAAKTDLDKIESSLEEAIETYFCYELRMKRVKGLNKLEDIAREMTAYFRESSTDVSVNSQVDIEGDMYKIVINKGIKAIVTLGDALNLPEVLEFFKNPDNLLPCIAGINDAGKPILVDAKHYDTTLIAGKQRSGKSWYLLAILLALMLFNTPEYVQFLIIDPKESNLFKTVALMPHVCGLHNNQNILGILRDVIEKEGGRRKKILADHGCDTIWELRERFGINLPVLYIVIDEVMTVLADLKSNEKEFFDLMNVIISQLPSQGIRIIFVPHRAQGVVEKTTRALISYTVAIRAETEIVMETLGIKKWDRPLVNPGDAAIKLQDIGKEMYVRGVAITTKDEKNSELIYNVAKAYYKMGVEIPDMSSLGCGYNRNEEYIKEKLQAADGTTRVQFNIDDVDDIDIDIE